MIAAKEVSRLLSPNVVLIQKNFSEWKSILKQTTRLPPQCYLTNRNRGSSFPSAPKTCKRQCPCCKSGKFHFNNLVESAEIKFAFASATKNFLGQLEIFTMIGGTPSAAQWKAIWQPRESRVYDPRYQHRLFWYLKSRCTSRTIRCTPRHAVNYRVS